MSDSPTSDDQQIGGGDGAGTLAVVAGSQPGDMPHVAGMNDENVGIAQPMAVSPDDHLPAVFDPENLFGSGRGNAHLGPRERLDRNRKLLTMFLPLDRPLVTRKMLPFLQSDGVLDLLLDFVVQPALPETAEAELARYTRRDKEILKTKAKTGGTRDQPPRTFLYEASSNEHDVREISQLYFRERIIRDAAHANAARLSYAVLGLFEEMSVAFESFIDKRIPYVVVSLCRILEPTARGNFFHFRDIMLNLLLRDAQKVIDTLACWGLLGPLLDYAHESAIGDLFIHVMSFRKIRPKDRVKFFRNLRKTNVISTLSTKLCDPAHHRAARPVCALLLRMFDEIVSVQGADMFFSVLVEKSGMFLERIRDTAIAVDSSVHNDSSESCAILLDHMLTLSGKTIMSSVGVMAPTIEQNMMGCIRKRLHFSMRERVEALGEKLIALHDDDDEVLRKPDPPPEGSIVFGAFVVPKPLGVAKLAYLNLLAELILCGRQEVVPRLPEHTWRVLVEWFFEYPHNSFYGKVFYKIMYLVVKFNHQPTLENVLSQFELVTRLVQFASSGPENSHNFACMAFVRLIMNILRLASETQSPDGYLHSFLESHILWKEYLPELIAHTEAQSFVDPEMVPPMTSIVPHFAPFCGPLIGDYNGSHVHLGSSYALVLGFDKPFTPLPTAKAKPVGSSKPPAPTLSKKKLKRQRKKMAALLRAESEARNGSPSASASGEHPERSETPASSAPAQVVPMRTESDDVGDDSAATKVAANVGDSANETTTPTMTTAPPTNGVAKTTKSSSHKSKNELAPPQVSKRQKKARTPSPPGPGDRADKSNDHTRALTPDPEKRSSSERRTSKRKRKSRHRRSASVSDPATDSENSSSGAKESSKAHSKKRNSESANGDDATASQAAENAGTSRAERDASVVSSSGHDSTDERLDAVPGVLVADVVASSDSATTGSDREPPDE